MISDKAKKEIQIRGIALIMSFMITSSIIIILNFIFQFDFKLLISFQVFIFSIGIIWGFLPLKNYAIISILIINSLIFFFFITINIFFKYLNGELSIKYIALLSGVVLFLILLVIIKSVYVYIKKKDKRNLQQ